MIRVNRFNSTDYQVVTRVDKGGALHIYHQRRQPQGEQGSTALPGALLREPQVLSHQDCFSQPSTPDSMAPGPSASLPAPPSPLAGLEEKHLAMGDCMTLPDHSSPHLSG